MDSGLLTSYGPVDGIPELRALVGGLFGVGAESVVITSGGSEALHLALLCLTDPGESIQLPRPAFPGFRQLAQLAGLLVTRYDVPTQAVEHAPALHDGIAVVCTPHNPLGTVTSRGSVGVPGRRVIWDVSHALVYGDNMAEFCRGLQDPDVVIFSFSKLLRVPGARIGCLVAKSQELIGAVNAVKTHMSMSASMPSQLIALRLLSDPATPDALYKRHEELSGLRTLLTQAVTGRTGLSVAAGLAGTHLYCESPRGDDPWQVLKDRGLVGLPGYVFDSAVPGVRLCFAQEPGLIRQVMERLV
jgi:aspartate/methionine/tyrosine aminotransferase